MKRSAFFISDGTGITAETLGQSLLAQFENITFNKFTRPYIDSVEKARAMVQQINKAAEKDEVQSGHSRNSGDVRRLHDRYFLDLPGAA
jgi:regulator of PEP synthase PpsR (kinase-PPPase family)